MLDRSSQGLTYIMHRVGYGSLHMFSYSHVQIKGRKPLMETLREIQLGLQRQKIHFLL